MPPLNPPASGGKRHSRCYELPPVHGGIEGGYCVSPDTYVLTKTAFAQELHTERVKYILVAPQKEWRTDGRLAHDAYTLRTLLPILRDLEATGQVKLVHQSTQDLVAVYRINENQECQDSSLPSETQK